MRVRVVVVLSFVTGALVFPAAPAQAQTVGTIALTGFFQVGSGLAYPCTGWTSTPDLAKCPFTGEGNRVGATFAGSGVGGLAHGATAGTKAATAEVGTWNLSLTGVIQGWCWLSAGSMIGAMNPYVSLGSKAKGRTLSVAFTEVAQKLFLAGATSKGETVFGVFVFVADTTNGSTCTNKHAKTFLFSGQLHVVA